MNPEYPQCYCNALLNFSGQHKYKVAQEKLNGIKALQHIKQLHDNDIVAFHSLRESMENQVDGNAQIIDTYISHPELKAATDYHFSELEGLSGELHIIGLSPQNDSHIFACIEKSAVDKIIFYVYGEPPKTLPLTKPYEVADIKKLWKSLDANLPKYNCGRKYPNSKKAKKFFELFNVLSFDPITEDEIRKEANSIPDFIAKPLCQEAMKLIESQETPKNEDELYKQFRYISRIALREGIYPSAFYLLLIDNFSKLK